MQTQCLLSTSYLCLAGMIFLCMSSQVCMARPTDLHEQKQGYYKSLFNGAYVGFETFLSLVGYYEDDEVKRGLAQDTFTINEVDVEDQTEIKVVGLGLGRTGTTSLVIALEMLSYTVVHDDEQTELTDIYARWEEEDIDEDEFHEILGLRGFNATVKTAELSWVLNHPESKAILTVRDNPDKYVDSWLVAAPFIDIIRRRPFCWMKTANVLIDSLEYEFMIETTGNRPDKYLDRDTLRKHYETHIQDVQAAIPANRLLTFNVKQGWEPLCNFLDVPVPEGIPFPHVHTRAKLEGEMYFLVLVTWIWPLIFIIPLWGGIIATRNSFLMK